MRVDDQDVPIEIVQYLKDAITNLPEAELIFDCRNVNTLMEGLNQKTPNIATLRARVSARLEARAVPAPILNVLRTATLCQKVFSVLSLKAIKHGGNDWAAYFGLEAYVGSLLVDERTEVRSVRLQSPTVRHVCFACPIAHTSPIRRRGIWPAQETDAAKLGTNIER